MNDAVCAVFGETEYGFGGGVGTGMPLVSGYELGAFAVASNGRGWPQEKQNEAWPGVAVVSDPHEGQRTCVIGPAAALPPPSGIDGDGAPTEGLARTLHAAADPALAAA